jgi:heme-degrading monooxygenase HmoA
MAEIVACPPPPDVITSMLEIPHMEVAPTILATQQGPDRHVGPEEAGAILILQATFTDPQKADGFWHEAVKLMALLAEAPGFIRRYAFPDGPSMTLIALWRTMDDARAFASSPEHRAAMQRLDEERWEYTHFAGLWEIARRHDRVVYCEVCDGVTPINEGACRKCGTELDDIYRREPTPA